MVRMIERSILHSHAGRILKTLVEKAPADPLHQADELGNIVLGAFLKNPDLHFERIFAAAARHRLYAKFRWYNDDAFLLDSLEKGSREWNSQLPSALNIT